MTRKERYKRRKDANECVFCGKKHATDYVFVMCVECRKAQKKSKNKCHKKRAKTGKTYKIVNWGKRAVDNSRKKDKMYARYNAVKAHFITQDYLFKMRETQSNKCYHCGIIMQNKNRREHDGVTVERLDNSVGHAQANCVVCCYSCNTHRVEEGSVRATKWLQDREAFAKEHNTRLAIRQVIDDIIRSISPDTRSR